MASTALPALLFFLLVAVLANAAAAPRAMNVIDRCWRRDPNWAANRQHLAMCSVGFAGNMTWNAGRGLRHYVVTDDGDDPLKPRPGTLRYGATMLPRSVWITFGRDMSIALKQALVVKSYTTIDGRGADVHIAGGAGFLLYEVRNVIVHGLQFHHIRLQPSGPVMGKDGKVTKAASGDGDSIRVVSSTKVWIDHNTFYAGEDGLVDATRGSTRITISNNWFRDHDKVMLLGHDDDYVQDKQMKVTVAFNRFGPRCNQRMPRVRHGYVHVVNNFYDGWRDYAIGGSMRPSIRSEGNMFVAASGGAGKEVTRRIRTFHGDAGESGNWRSVKDEFENGAFFRETGSGRASPMYRAQEGFTAADASAVRSLTRDAGALRCRPRYRC